MNSILSNFIMDVCSEGIQRRQGDWKTMYNVLVFFFLRQINSESLWKVASFRLPYYQKYCTSWSWVLSALERDLNVGSMTGRREPWAAMQPDTQDPVDSCWSPEGWKGRSPGGIVTNRCPCWDLFFQVHQDQMIYACLDPFLSPHLTHSLSPFFLQWP